MFQEPAVMMLKASNRLRISQESLNRCSNMSNRVPSEPSQISVKMTVRDQAQARELDMAWREIISGERLARTEALEHDIQSIMDRAQEALLIIETAIGNNPTSGQAGRLVRFLAGLYNGYDYPFDLTELRGLDTRLANACLDYLNYDRLGKREVHRHLTGGDQRLHQWLEDYGIKPRRDNERD
jgi:hypothetical protein